MNNSKKRCVAFPLIWLLIAGCGQKFDPDELVNGILSENSQEAALSRQKIVEIGDEMADRLISILRDEARRPKHQAVAEILHDMLKAGTLRDFKASKVAGVLGDVLRDKQTPVGARHKIAAILGDFKVATAVRPLIAVLGSGDPQIEQLSIDSLSKIGEITVGNLVAERDDSDTPLEKRASIINALSRLSDTLSLQLKDADPEKRLKAVQLLGQVENETARQKVSELAKDADAKVRLGVVSTLKTKPSEAEKEILYAAASDSDTSVAAEAACALAEEKDGRASALLVRAASFSEPTLRVRAIEALARLGDHQVEPALTQALEDPEIRVRQAAAEALEALAGESGREAMRKAIELSDQDPKVRLICARALGKMGDQQGVQKLLSLLSLKDSAIRVPAIQALADVGRPAVDSLLKTLDEPPLARQEGACQALGKIGDAKAVEALVGVLLRALPASTENPDGEKNPDVLNVTEADVQVAAIKALAEMADQRGVEPIARNLSSPDPRIRWYAEWALVQLDEAALDVLLSPLPENIPTTPSLARVLGLIGDESAAPKLVSYLESDNIDLQIQAAESLGELAVQGVPLEGIQKKLLQMITGSPKAESESKSKTLELRKACLHTLGFVGSGETLPALAELLVNESHPDIRFAVLLAIGNILQASDAQSEEMPSEVDILLRILLPDTNLIQGLASLEMIQRQALLRLGELRHLKAIPAIVDILAATAPGEVLHEAAALAYLRIMGKKFEGKE